MAKYHVGQTFDGGEEGQYLIIFVPSETNSNGLQSYYAKHTYDEERFDYAEIREYALDEMNQYTY